MTLHSKKVKNNTIDFITHALSEKKAREITILNLKKIDHAVCDYYVIAHGTSDRHTQSLAEHLVDDMRDKLRQKPWHIEGMQNKEWILLDYGDIIVHVFQENIRRFYNIEDLWADAEITVLEDEL